MKTFTRKLPFSLICAIAFAVAFTPATFADDCSAASFKAAASITLDAAPFGIAAADFNGDGHLDLVHVPNGISQDVLVLYGRGGTEKFGPPTNVSVGGEARRVAVGDVNGDGKPDLVFSLDIGFAEPSARLSVLLNDGTGKFGAPNTVPLQGNASQIVLADLNNDAKLDIVAPLFAFTSDGQVAILLGNGLGSFSQAANSPISTFSRNVAAIVVGDFNEDGKRDLALPGSVSGVDVFPGDGAGGFGPVVNTAFINSFFFMAGGDFNEDGHLDLLLDKQMVLGSGTAGFSAPIVIDHPENTSLALTGDVNHDNHLDVVTAGFVGLTIMLGDGTGNLARGKSYTSGITAFAPVNSFAALGDFNEDGKIDIAAVQPLGIGILDGDGTGAFNDALNYQTSIPGMRDLVAADFNNDGKKDFAIIGPGFSPVPGGSRVEVALGDGSGTFTRKSLTNFGFVSLLSGITTADFNNDGKFDLAVTQSSNGTVTILLNDGTGGFPADGISAPGIFVGAQPSSLKAGDFNNDNKADLVVLTPGSNTFAVLLGNGSGGFTNAGSSTLQGTSSFFDDVDIGDFDVDGKSDVAIVRSSASVVDVRRGDGTGHFSNFAVLPVPGIPVSVVVRDFSGDGKPDIAVSSTLLEPPLRQSSVTVFINNAGAGFNPGTNYPTDAAGILGIGDFNSDNKPDLIVSGGASFTGSNMEGLVVLTNKGDGTFNPRLSTLAGPSSDQLTIADFNNDGKDDVLVTQTNGSVGMLLNNFTTSQPCLSVNDVSITEGDTGTTNAIFAVTLSAASAQTVRVNYFASTAFFFAFGPGATRDVDYENVPGTVTFLPGETTQTISIPVKGDINDEPDQLFFVTLTTPINAAIGDGRGVGNIIDNDPVPIITINDVSVVEGTQVQSVAKFTVSLNAASEKDVSVQFELQPGTASPNTDYGNFSSTVNFPIGVVSQTITVGIAQDNVFETDETFFVNLGNAVNATIGDALGQGTIVNDDSQPTIAIAATAFRIEGAAGTSNSAPFEVRLSNPSHQTITVAFATADGSATAGIDYTGTSGTITFNPGETSKVVSVEVTGDNTDETNETFVVNLSNASNATISAAQGVGTIQDDDGPTLSINSVSVSEGQSGFTNAVFTVTLSAPSVQDVFVTYATTGDTATSNVDFQRIFGLTLFIPAGATSGTLTVRVFGDLFVEPDEQFFVTLLNASNATIGNGQGTGTIVNDDSTGKLQFSSQTHSATEDAGSVVITVTRVDGATGSVTVDYATSNGTANAGSDYTSTSGTLTFNQGQTSQTFSIPIVNDNVFEPDETINIALTNPTGGASLGTPATATLTINPPPLLLLLDESGPGSHQVAALDSLLLMRDPFPVISTLGFFNSGLDRNTRVIVFLANLQLAPGDVASSVTVNLFDTSGQSHDVAAEDLRAVPFTNFMQISFRLPDNLRGGVCVVKVKGPHNQESNPGTIRIGN